MNVMMVALNRMITIMMVANVTVMIVMITIAIVVMMIVLVVMTQLSMCHLSYGRSIALV